jgi:hypothetical protein
LTEGNEKKTKQKWFSNDQAKLQCSTAIGIFSTKIIIFLTNLDFDAQETGGQAVGPNEASYRETELLVESAKISLEMELENELLGKRGLGDGVLIGEA